MPIGGTDNFAHGTYGDTSGVVFYGPQINGFWRDSFPVSDRFIDPLFRAILDRAKLSKRSKVPRGTAEWMALTGWRDTIGRTELPAADVIELIEALTAISRADLDPHVAEFAVTPDECLRCASAMCGFLRERVGAGHRVYIERA